PGEVVGRHLDRDLVSGQHPDPVLAHASGSVRQDLVFVLELDAKHRVGKHLGHGATELDQIFLRHTYSCWRPPRGTGRQFMVACAPEVKGSRPELAERRLVEAAQLARVESVRSLLAEDSDGLETYPEMLVDPLAIKGIGHAAQFELAM